MIQTIEQLKTQIAQLQDLIAAHPEMESWAKMGINHLKGLLRKEKYTTGAIVGNVRPNNRVA